MSDLARAPDTPALRAFRRPDRELVRRAPKVQLHEHLDGSLRPTTVLELAREAGYGDLPEAEPEAQTGPHRVEDNELVA